jgi:hypothetical protein
MEDPLKITISGDAAARLREAARRLDIPVELLVQRALANGVFVVEQTQPGERVVLESPRKGRHVFEPS